MKLRTLLFAIALLAAIPAAAVAPVHMVTDISANGGNGAVWGQRPLDQFGGSLFFLGDEGSSGPELWRTDGTDIGTYSLGHFASQGSFPYTRKVGQRG
jgi:ELWxxDGT repeat protein